jgi:MEDS: MEthanogen/methylotroph, DcmR Sensory domain/Histidine kinase-like ATPase domain
VARVASIAAVLWRTSSLESANRELGQLSHREGGGSAGIFDTAVIGAEMTVDVGVVGLGSGDHVVQFYEREVDLFEFVGEHLARAVHAEATSVVIASAAHRRAFEIELERAGIDTGEARRTGRLLMFDAASTMTQFMEEGRIDPKAFCRVFEGILDAACDVDRPLHIYGEMVALLWEAGEVLAAIELESLWNDQVESHRFSLLCAYPSTSVAASEHTVALRQICRLHSSVVGHAPRLDAPHSRSAVSERTADFAAEPGAPGAARRFVRDALREWGHADQNVVNEVTLVVSELATNAVVHTGVPFSVGVRVLPTQRLLRVSVRDASPTMSSVGHSSIAARMGWGLSLVAHLASCWGVEGTPDAKVVWAEFFLIPK